MKHTFWIGIVALSLLSAGLFVGCGKDDEAKETKGKSSAVTPVQIAEVVRGDISALLSYTGSIKPLRKINVVPDIPGKIAKIYVTEGDRVSPDQVLAELDNRTVQLLSEQAEAGLAVAEASFNSASKDWERTRELHEKGTISPQQVEKAQLGYEASKAQLQQAKSGLKLARHQLEVSVMKAPFGGIITGKNMNEGEYINPAMGGMGSGGGSVVTLMDLSEVKIEVQVSEHELEKIRVGQDARVTVDAYPGKTFFGNVSNVHPAAHPISRTFKVEIAVANPDLVLKAGTDAGVKLSIEVHKGVLFVPEKSVLEQAGACFLFVADGDTARRRGVKTGLRSEGLVEIIEGVLEGERVIGEGNYGLKDGTKVAW